MRGTGFSWRASAHLLSQVAVPVLLSLTGDAFAAEPVPLPAPANLAPDALVQGLDLAQCRDIALMQQPALTASRLSMTAAVEKQQALDKIRFAALISRDLPTRRKQAAAGLQASQGAISVAESETIYGVTFSYVSTLYAHEQLEVADAAIADLKRLLESVEKAVDSGDARREIGVTQVDTIKTNILLAQARREEAVIGWERAAAALREAMGLGTDCPLTLRQRKLFDLTTTPDKQQVIALALARRGELAQAEAAYQVTCFEIEAQKSSFFLSSKTFAVGSDIHAIPVPQGEYDGATYKPGAVGLEMPALLAGKRKDREQVARTYHERAGAVVEKARNLIALDAEETYLKWLEASRKVPQLREAVVIADRVAATNRKNFNPGPGGKGTVEDVLSSGTQSANVKLQLNQARYQLLLALAGLERATAGGFCAGFDAAR